MFDCTENCIRCNNNNYTKPNSCIENCNKCKNNKSTESNSCINNCIRHNNNSIKSKSFNTKNTSKKPNNPITTFRVSQFFFKDMELTKFKKYLIKRHINILNIIKEDKNKLLIYASGVGNIDIVQYLCDNGADINTVNEYGQSLLSIAIINKKQIKKILVFIKKF